MRPLLPLTIAACVLLTSAATAACYARKYDAAHLARNPRQQVRAIAVKVTDGLPAGASISATLRGSDWTWATGGDCQPQGEALKCTFPETGGAALLAAGKQGLRLEVVGAEGLSLDAEGHEGAGGERRIKSLDKAGDGLFLLGPAPDSACR